MVELVDVKLHLNKEMEKKERFLEQQARANWLKLGDNNTSFFISLLLKESVRIEFVVCKGMTVLLPQIVIKLRILLEIILLIFLSLVK